MARVTFKKGEEQTLRGTFIGMTYRYVGGKQFACAQLPEPLPENPSKAEVERQRKQKVTFLAVAGIQMMIFERGKDRSIQRMQELADKYNTFMHHAKRRYKQWHERFSDDERLAKAIAYWYVTGRMQPEFPELEGWKEHEHPP